MALRVPEHKPWDIEPVAQKFLDRYWDPREQWVDIETIMERDLDVLIDYTDAGCLRALGAIGRRSSDGRFVIIVDEQLADRSPCRYRFTLAQEVSHLLLHRDLLESVATVDDAFELQDSLSAEQYAGLEASANRCAAAILMPQRQFRQAAQDAYALWFGRIMSAAGSVPPDPLLKRVIDDLAKLYQVSFQAARIRLQRWPVKVYDDILESARRAQPNVGTGWS